MYIVIKYVDFEDGNYLDERCTILKIGFNLEDAREFVVKEYKQYKESPAEEKNEVLKFEDGGRACGYAIGIFDYDYEYELPPK